MAKVDKALAKKIEKLITECEEGDEELDLLNLGIRQSTEAIPCPNRSLSHQLKVCIKLLFLPSNESRELSLNGNQIKELPPEIGYLTNLEKLHIQNNQLTSLIDEIGCLRRLEDLSVSGNQLGTVTPAIGECCAMEVLDMSCCRLTTLPKEFTYMTRMMELNLGANSLRELPHEIGRMTRLCKLNVSDNQLTDLPVSLGMCIGLGKLGSGINIDRNPIQSAEMKRKFQIGADHLLDFLEKRMMMQGGTSITFPPIPKLQPRIPRSSAQRNASMPQGAGTGTGTGSPAPNRATPPTPAVKGTGTGTGSPVPPIRPKTAAPPAVSSPAPASSAPVVSAHLKGTKVLPPIPSKAARAPSPAARSTPTPPPRASPSTTSNSSITTSNNNSNTTSSSVEDLKQWVTKTATEFRFKLDMIREQLHLVNSPEDIIPFATLVKKIQPSLEYIKSKKDRGELPPLESGSIMDDKLTNYKKVMRHALLDLELCLTALEHYTHEQLLPANVSQMSKVLQDLLQEVHDLFPSTATAVPSTPMPLLSTSSYDTPPAREPVYTPAPVEEPVVEYEPTPQVQVQVQSRLEEPPPAAEDELVFECPHCGKRGPESFILPHIDFCTGSDDSSDSSHSATGRSKEPTVKEQWTGVEYAKVVKPYEPRDGTELRLKVGDIVTILRRSETEMFKGGLYEQVGFFPISHCVPTKELPVKISNTPAPSAASPSSHSSSSSSSSKHKKNQKVSLEAELERLKKLGIKQQYSSERLKAAAVPTPAPAPAPVTPARASPSGGTKVLPSIPVNPVNRGAPKMTKQPANSGYPSNPSPVTGVKGTGAPMTSVKGSGAPVTSVKGSAPPVPPKSRTKKFLIKNRNDEKDWVKIELKNSTKTELYDAVAKRLRVAASRIAEIHTATVLDEVTGLADLKYCKVLKIDADVAKQPNGTFLEVVLHPEFDVSTFVAKYLETEKKGLKELISLAEELGLDSSQCDSKLEVLNLLRQHELQKLSFKQLMSVADSLNIDWSTCDAKSELIELLLSSK